MIYKQPLATVIELDCMQATCIQAASYEIVTNESFTVDGEEDIL